MLTLFSSIFISISIILSSPFQCILQFAKFENTGWCPKTARGLFTPRYQFFSQNVHCALALYLCAITAVLESPYFKESINSVHGNYYFFWHWIRNTIFWVCSWYHSHQVSIDNWNINKTWYICWMSWVSRIWNIGWLSGLGTLCKKQPTVIDLHCIHLTHAQLQTTRSFWETMQGSMSTLLRENTEQRGTTDKVEHKRGKKSVSWLLVLCSNVLLFSKGSSTQSYNEGIELWEYKRDLSGLPRISECNYMWEVPVLVFDSFPAQF